MQPEPGRGAPPDTLIDLICYLELPDQPAIVPAGAGAGGGGQGGGQVAVMFCLGAEGEDGAVKDGAGFHLTASAPHPLPLPPQRYTCTCCPRPPPESQPAQSGRLCHTRRRQAAQTSDQILLALIGPWWAAPPGDLIQTGARSGPGCLVLAVILSASRNGNDGAAQVVQTSCLMTSQPGTIG